MKFIRACPSKPNQSTNSPITDCSSFGTNRKAILQYTYRKTVPSFISSNHSFLLSTVMKHTTQGKLYRIQLFLHSADPNNSNEAPFALCTFLLNSFYRHRPIGTTSLKKRPSELQVAPRYTLHCLHC